MRRVNKEVKRTLSCGARTGTIGSVIGDLDHRANHTWAGLVILLRANISTSCVSMDSQAARVSSVALAMEALVIKRLLYKNTSQHRRDRNFQKLSRVSENADVFHCMLSSDISGCGNDQCAC